MPISENISTGTEPQVTPVIPVSPATWLLLSLIKIYRVTLSPILAYFGGCRFHPTCSQYGLDAIRKYGAGRGGVMSVKRILRCHPFHPGGEDPVK